MPMHPVEKPWRQCLAEDRDAFLLADELGYTEAYCGSHYTDGCEKIPSSLVFLATLAYVSRQIRLGTATINLPNHHPVELAADIAMLDHLLDGRFNLGISAGGLASDAEAFATQGKNRQAMFVECFDIIEKIWASDQPYNINGKYWQVTTQQSMDTKNGIGEIPKPLQQPIPVFATVLEPFSKGVSAAAARGWLPISANFAHPDWLRSHWEMAKKGFQSTGRAAKIQDWRVARSIFVAETSAQARTYVRGENSPYRFYFANLLQKFSAMGKIGHFRSSRNAVSEPLRVDEIIEDMVIYGEPAEVAEKLSALREETGRFGTLLYVGADWLDPELGRKSMQLMMDSVLPRVR